MFELSINSARFIIGLAAAAVCFCGYLLHRLLLWLVFGSGPGIVIVEPVFAFLAMAALTAALMFVLLKVLSRPSDVRMIWGFFGGLTVVCIALYVWTLKPYYRVHADRLEITSWMSERTLYFDSINTVVIDSGVQRRRYYALSLVLNSGEKTYSLMKPAHLTLVLAHMPKDINCRTNKTPEDRRTVLRELSRAFTAAVDEKGLVLPSQCLAALRLTPRQLQ